MAPIDDLGMSVESPYGSRPTEENRTKIDRGSMIKPKVASFFAGIGGFDLAFEQAGFEVNFQCENRRFCGSVLRRHWPSVPSVEDVSTAEPKCIPGADVWCGGFPCQDLSVARGSLRRHGLNGSRSGLFFKFAELAQKKKPSVIVIENVHGLLNSNDGKDFAELLHTLGSLHYAVSWRLLNSRYFGLPQSRPRVYICAWLNDPLSAGGALFEDRAPMPTHHERSGFLETSWTSGHGPITPKLAFCLAATSGRHTGTDWSRNYVSYPDGRVRRYMPVECERIQGFPDDWTLPPGTQPDDVEKLDTLMRYHALGNAVTVNVAEWLARRIADYLLKPSVQNGIAHTTNGTAHYNGNGARAARTAFLSPTPAGGASEGRERTSELVRETHLSCRFRGR